ncbi:MAG: Zn-dependent hydrolase [Candidatus Aminicenantes bacterium]|nr:Zn-dependent hydrolase [Candidatus Aminicenantes bacterium]
MSININLARLRKHIEELGAIGRDPRGGLSRPSFSPADLEARAWLKDRIETAGLDHRVDGAGNIFGFLGEGGPVVMAGSHIDTVMNGGAFDGAAGVLAGLEALQRIRDEGYRLAKPLAVAAFTDEEGNLVGDFLGSRAFTGTLDRGLLEKGLTSFGAPLADVLGGSEFSIESILGAAAEAPALAAFLELHIEQGPTLDDESVPIGLVDVIAGKHYRWCSFHGQAGHAGTVPLELRRDAFLGLADFALRATQHVATRHYGSFVTIGKAHVHPGVFSIIPGRADFSFEFRSRSPETLATLETELFALAEEVAATRGLEFGSRVIDATSPVTVPEPLLVRLRAACADRGYEYRTLTSGAGHDAQILAAKAPTAMIFVPSPDGVSHAPEESIRWDDLEKGANLLLDALIGLAG